MRSRWLAAMSLVGMAAFACSSFDESPDVAPVDGDGGSDGGLASDVATGDSASTEDAPAACDPNKPFGAPVAIAETSSVFNDGLMMLNGAETVGVFASNRINSGYDLFLARRSSRDGAFAPPKKLPEAQGANINVDGDAWEIDPSLTADGLRMVYVEVQTTDRPGGLRITSRASIDDVFGAPVPALGIDPDTGMLPDGSRRWPFVVADASALYTYVDRPSETGSGTQGIDRLTRTNTVDPTYTHPVPMPELEGATVVVVNPPETRIFYARLDSGAMLFRIWSASRTAKTAPWTGMSVLADFTTTMPTASMIPSFVSVDECRLYLNADGHHFVATRGR